MEWRRRWCIGWETFLIIMNCNRKICIKIITAEREIEYTLNGVTIQGSSRLNKNGIKRTMKVGERSTVIWYLLNFKNSSMRGSNWLGKVIKRESRWSSRLKLQKKKFKSSTSTRKRTKQFLWGCIDLSLISGVHMWRGVTMQTRDQYVTFCDAINLHINCL